MGDSRLVHGAKTRQLHLELGMKRKRREEKNGRGIFRSLVSLSLPEFDCSRRWFIAPLFWLHMLWARPNLGVCFLSQPFQCWQLGGVVLVRLWCWCVFAFSDRYILKWCIACSRIFAPSILSSVLHMAGTECRAGPRRVLHWDDVGETQKRCSSGLRESPLDEKASSGGPPGELS